MKRIVHAAQTGSDIPSAAARQRGAYFVPVRKFAVGAAVLAVVGIAAAVFRKIRHKPVA